MKCKKSLSLMLALALSLALVGCNSGASNPVLDGIGDDGGNAGIERPYNAAVPDITPAPLTTAQLKPVDNSKLPRVDINFLDEDYVISKEKKADALVSISNTEDKYCIKDQPATIKVRGNSTAEPLKKPLKVKFEDKQDIFGGGADKTWTLLANYFDRTEGIHNYAAYNLYRYMTDDKGFESAVTFVDVYADGEYQGVYTLCDQVEVSDNRIQIGKDLGDSPESTDYLIEHDFRVSYDDPANGMEGKEWFWMTDVNEAFEVKSPDMEETEDTAYTSYMRSYMDDVYRAADAHDWDKIQELIDVQSFIDGFMVGELVKSNDIFQSSVYYYKTADGKLTFATLWDCDLAFGGGDMGDPEKELLAEQDFIFGRLMQIPEFREMYVKQFNENCEDYKEHLYTYIDEATNAYHDELANDYVTWSGTSVWCNEEMQAINSFDGQIDYMKEWIDKRIAFMKTQYAE